MSFRNQTVWSHIRSGFVGPDLGPNCLPKVSAGDRKFHYTSLHELIKISVKVLVKIGELKFIVYFLR